jgi:hypothetical protein
VIRHHPQREFLICSLFYHLFENTKKELGVSPVFVRVGPVEKAL